jgi:molybdate-binding protein
MPSRSWPAILLLAWGMLNLLVESFAMVLPDFIPLQSERYDLVMRRRTLDLPAVRAFLDILQRATIRRKFEVLARYDTTEMGAAIA